MNPRALLAAALAAALAGCPGSLEDPDRFADQFGICPSVPALFTDRCATAGCHTASGPAGGLDLASDNAYGRLAGAKAAGGAGLLIDPDTPSASVLYTKVTSTPPFGSRMPLGADPLDDTTASCILTWIEKGGSP